MTTKSPKINITFEKNIAGSLIDLAKHEYKSLAELAKELILNSLAIREDIALSKIASAFDIEGVKTVSHDKAWK